MLDAEIDERTGCRDALVVHDVELDLGERRSDLVLHNLDLGAVADDLAFGRLDLVLAADIDANRREKLEGAAAASGFGRIVDDCAAREQEVGVVLNLKVVAHPHLALDELFANLEDLAGNGLLHVPHAEIEA